MRTDEYENDFKCTVIDLSQVISSRRWLNWGGQKDMRSFDMGRRCKGRRWCIRLIGACILPKSWHVKEAASSPCALSIQSLFHLRKLKIGNYKARNTIVNFERLTCACATNCSGVSTDLAPKTPTSTNI